MEALDKRRLCGLRRLSRLNLKKATGNQMNFEVVASNAQSPHGTHQIPTQNQDDEDMVEEILNRRPSSMNQPRTDNYEEYGENVAMANRDAESGGSAAAG